MADTEIEKFKVYTAAQLKSWLEILKRKTTGNKSELVLRLLSVPEQERGEFPISSKQTLMADGDDDVSDDEDTYEDSVDDEVQMARTMKAKERKNDIHTEDRNNERNTNECANDREEDSYTQTTGTNLMKKEWLLMKREIEVLKKEIQMKSKENELLTREIELSQMSGARRQMRDTEEKKDLTHIKEFISEFSGMGDSFQHFEKQLKNIQQAYELDDNNMKVLVSLKLKGKALRWFHSRDDITTVGFKNLLTDMCGIFNDRPTKLEMKRVFEGRKWQPGETFQQYFQDKIILGNQLAIDEDEMVEHLIEGIPDGTLASNARLQCFPDKLRLLEAFKSVKFPIKQKAVAIPSTSRQALIRGTEKQQIRCFNCNSLGHMANDCRKEKREPGSCYVCAEMGHLAAQCPKRKEVRPIGYINSDCDEEYDPY